ncbi:MBL fold metallo-hydrolase [Deinococcus yavapaiensis]|uniref:MBL fold metallo-hydrolase n=1 Tax=Deinococcus yavapaiensis TaxID=309889 RepID=UPI001FE28723|nr:MBL fold metallo-hydrolase [Deinococcus yavapaiensis]
MTSAYPIELDGTDEVGASAYLYLLPEGNLLVDAGLRPGVVGDMVLSKLEVLEGHLPTAMVLTHAHPDHFTVLLGDLQTTFDLAARHGWRATVDVEQPDDDVSLLPRACWNQPTPSETGSRP